MRPIIRDRTKELKVAEKIGMTWYFEKTIEKVGLLLMVLLSIYTVVRIIFTGFW